MPKSAPLQIAIDGPVGAGKTDISGRLAKELGAVYLYTGAMYRALAYACIREGVPCTDEKRVLAVLRKVVIDLVEPKDKSKRSYKALVNGEDVTEELFSFAVGKGASDVGTIPQVRKSLVERQKELARNRSVVVEGRDIGLRVLPSASLKIYLTASVEERAQRRLSQIHAKGANHITLERVIEEIIRRDEQDSNRLIDPLQKLPDAWELDTTGFTQEEVVKKILDELKARGLV